MKEILDFNVPRNFQGVLQNHRPHHVTLLQYLSQYYWLLFRIWNNLYHKPVFGFKKNSKWKK